MWILTATLLGCPKGTPTPEAPTAPDPVPAATEPVVRASGAFLDIHGGDGDGIEALWLMGVTVVLENGTANTLAVEAVRWEALDLGLASERPSARAVEPGQTLELTQETYVPVDLVRQVRDEDTIRVRAVVRWTTAGQEVTETAAVHEVPLLP